MLKRINSLHEHVYASTCDVWTSTDVHSDQPDQVSQDTQTTVGQQWTVRYIQCPQLTTRPGQLIYDVITDVIGV